jgi:hypothetical protein
MAKTGIYETSLGVFGTFAAFLGIIALVYTQLTPSIPDINLLPKPSLIEQLATIKVEGRIFAGDSNVSGLACSEIEVAIMPEGMTGDTAVRAQAMGINLLTGCAYSLSESRKYAGKNLVLKVKPLLLTGRTYSTPDKVFNIPEGSDLQVNLDLDAVK